MAGVVVGEEGRVACKEERSSILGVELCCLLCWW